MATLLIVGSDQNDWEGVYVCVGEEGKGGIYSFYYFMNIIYLNEKKSHIPSTGSRETVPYSNCSDNKKLSGEILNKEGPTPQSPF